MTGATSALAGLGATSFDVSPAAASALVSGQRPLDPIDIGGKGEIIVDHHGDAAPALVTPRGTATLVTPGGTATTDFDDINGRPETGSTNSKNTINNGMNIINFL